MNEKNILTAIDLLGNELLGTPTETVVRDKLKSLLNKLPYGFPTTVFDAVRNKLPERKITRQSVVNIMTGYTGHDKFGILPIYFETVKRHIEKQRGFDATLSNLIQELSQDKKPCL